MEDSELHGRFVAALKRSQAKLVSLVRRDLWVVFCEPFVSASTIKHMFGCHSSSPCCTTSEEPPLPLSLAPCVPSLALTANVLALFAVTSVKTNVAGTLVRSHRGGSWCACCHNSPQVWRPPADFAVSSWRSPLVSFLPSPPSFSFSSVCSLFSCLRLLPLHFSFFHFASFLSVSLLLLLYPRYNFLSLLLSSSLSLSHI